MRRPEHDQDSQPHQEGAREDAAPGRDGRDHAARLARLKAEIRDGTYRADIKDIAKQLARAMETLE